MNTIEITRNGDDLDIYSETPITTSEFAQAVFSAIGFEHASMDVEELSRIGFESEDFVMTLKEKEDGKYSPTVTDDLTGARLTMIMVNTLRDLQDSYEEDEEWSA